MMHQSEPVSQKANRYYLLTFSTLSQTYFLVNDAAFQTVKHWFILRFQPQRLVLAPFTLSFYSD